METHDNGIFDKIFALVVQHPTRKESSGRDRSFQGYENKQKIYEPHLIMIFKADDKVLLIIFDFLHVQSKEALWIQIK